MSSTGGTYHVGTVAKPLLSPGNGAAVTGGGKIKLAEADPVDKELRAIREMFFHIGQILGGANKNGGGPLGNKDFHNPDTAIGVSKHGTKMRLGPLSYEMLEILESWKNNVEGRSPHPDGTFKNNDVFTDTLGYADELLHGNSRPYRYYITPHYAHDDDKAVVDGNAHGAITYYSSPTSGVWENSTLKEFKHHLLRLPPKVWTEKVTSSLIHLNPISIDPRESDNNGTVRDVASGALTPGPTGDFDGFWLPANKYNGNT